jgi:hypothetical protein
MYSHYTIRAFISDEEVSAQAELQEDHDSAVADFHADWEYQHTSEAK